MDKREIDLSLSEYDPVKTNLYRYLAERINNQQVEFGHILHQLKQYKNNGNALYFIGYMHHQGIGVNQNYEKAVKYYRRAVMLNNMEGMLMLGILYQKGLGGLGVDYQKAYSLYETSLELGNKRVLPQMADLYEKGNGVERSKEMAIKLYKRAIKELEVDSPNYSGILLSLSFLYHMCEPLVSDNVTEIEKAAKYLYKAIQLGNRAAESQLRAISENHGFILLSFLYHKLKKYKEKIEEKEEVIRGYRKKVDQLNRQIIELSYIPGNPGYIDAKEHFKEVCNMIR